MFCSACGTKNPDTASFCMSCGTALTGLAEADAQAALDSLGTPSVEDVVTQSSPTPPTETIPSVQDQTVQAAPVQDQTVQAAVVPPQSYASSYPPAEPAQKEGKLHKLGSLPLWAILLAVVLIVGGVAVAKSGMFGAPQGILSSVVEKDYAGTWVTMAEIEGLSATGTLNLADDGSASFTLGGSALGFSMNFADIQGTWELEDDKIVLRSNDLSNLVDTLNTSFGDGKYNMSYDGKLELEPKGNSLVLVLSDSYSLTFERQ